ncbi:aldose 1-epimerase [[Mycobacterium] nativiensis]|uniref:Aldose 1-epimerase n=1 Tax=[Mycobacterium] nativiensis TaxID=2855503 RepID=A0ABU5XTT7_9MYCO|nr:aldose 1-epimerase [Mycolicibacter sp. MYC340]MEB3031152.1 aldose 1-epimerase [Mycolicibacter sp. MYC340]
MTEYEAATLRDPSSELTATFVPSAGMIGTSLADGGVELLGQRKGLRAYVSDHKTMGIPLLYPWANRLSGNDYRVDGTEVTLTPGSGGVHTDEHGSPIHGTLAGDPGWRVVEQSTSELTAELDFASRPELLTCFPFPHLLRLAITLVDRTLTVRTTVTATTDAAVPLCFGFHPYLHVPDVPRAQWLIETPAMRARLVDARSLPTGATDPHPASTGVLGDQVFDDGFDELADGAVFAVSGGGRRIEVRFDHGYPAAQIYAPATEDVICFEPMAAPTDALRRGGYRVARPGEPGVAQFSIRVTQVR